jgi:hypothetical protein
MLTPAIRWSLLMTWLVALLGGLALVANDLSAQNLLLLGLVGLMPPAVLIFLSRETPRTTAEIIRDVEAGR